MQPAPLRSALANRFFPLLLGVFVFLAGSAFLASRFEEVSSRASATEGPAADSLVIENVRAFARLYGYVKYFHPSDAAGAIDWDRFAVYGVRQVRQATNRADLKRRLEALFRPIASTVQLYATGESPPAPAPGLVPDDTSGLKLVAWQHVGLGSGSTRNVYRSLRLHRKDTLKTGPGYGFGTIVKSIDAAPYRGHDIKLQAAVKAAVEGSENRAQLWLRVDRPQRQPGFFDNMRDRPITASDWSTYEIVGHVAEDAVRIVFGGFLHGEGRAWLDEFMLFARESAEEEWTPVPLENASFEQGAVGEPPASWGAGSPGYQFSTTAATAYEERLSVMIESSGAVKVIEGPLFEARAEAGEVVNKALGRGLSAQIPLALYSREGHTLRPADAPSPDRLKAALEAVPLETLTAEDVALRLADVVIAWNVFQHFYPYFGVVDVDWDAVLTRTLRRTLGDRTAEDFLYTLQRMVARLDDGHGGVRHAVMRAKAGLPLLVDWVEGQAVIVATADGARAGDACFERGDVVVSVDGTPAEELLREAKRYLSGSPQWKTYRALRRFGRGEHGTTAHLVLRRHGERVECEVTRNFDGRLQEERPAPIEELRPDVYYVDLTRAGMKAIRAQMEALAQAKGVIFDMRGYPNSNHAVLMHLSDKPLRSARWQKPQIIYPDHENLVGYDTTGRWTLPPRGPQFTGEVVFLTNARAISYAESVMGIVEYYELGEIVGQPTAGTNGNVNPFRLPGGYGVRFTGMRVLKHDRSQHHLIGIQPTVPVRRTLEGVRAGRDAYIEKALELIQGAAALSL